MRIIIQYLFIFIVSSTLGWFLELIYRRYFGKAKKWINPGFLSGPFLPIYGTVICVLYTISDIQINFILKLLLFILITTCIEFFTGIFFLKFYKIRLWDYTQLKFNIKGVIAPLYSFYWGILSLIFYFILFPSLKSKVDFINTHLEYSLFVGVFLGLFLVDMTNSFNLISKLKRFVEAAEDSKIVINFEQLKIEIREKFESFAEHIEGNIIDSNGNNEYRFSRKLRQFMRNRQKPTFMFPFKGDYQLIYRLQEHINNSKIGKKNK